MLEGMKHLTLSHALFALLLIVIYTGSTPVAAAADEEVTKWEYRVIRIDDGGRSGGSNAEAQLNKLGAEGWELVSVRADSQANRNSPIFYFKRPVQRAATEKKPAAGK